MVITIPFHTLTHTLSLTYNMTKTKDILTDYVMEQGVADIIIDYKYNFDNVKKQQSWVSTNVCETIPNFPWRDMASKKELRKTVRQIFKSFNYDPLTHKLFTYVYNNGPNEGPFNATTGGIKFILRRKEGENEKLGYRHLQHEYIKSLRDGAPVNKYTILDKNMTYTILCVGADVSYNDVVINE